MTLKHGRDKCNNYLIVALRFWRQDRNEKWADVVLPDSTSSKTICPFFTLNMREISLRESVSSGLHLAQQQGKNANASGYVDTTGHLSQSCLQQAFPCQGGLPVPELDKTGRYRGATRNMSLSHCEEALSCKATEGESPSLHTYGRVSIERSGEGSVCHVNFGFSEKSSSTPREGALVTFSGFDSHRPVYTQQMEMIA